MAQKLRRTAGILLPITALPSRYGIGCFSREAYQFVDWLRDAGQTYWQILPLGPTSYGDSPYQSFSTYAGNPYFISLEGLIDEGLLTREECDAVDFGHCADDIDYGKLYTGRYQLLRKAYERSNISQNPEYRQFMAEQSWWLLDYALFMALKNHFGGVAWTEWPKEVRLRERNAMDYFRWKLYFDIEFQQFMQFRFFKEWKALKTYANEQGIRMIGDIPIYVSMDSADAWARPELFQLDEENKPLAVAGCPPDAFAADGQLWGNPLYRWDYHRSTGYDWWLTRLWFSFQLYDVVRIDHFRGFDEYYSIPYGDKTAVNGHWEKGPGMDLFKAVKENLGEYQVIAEDLGYMTDSVRQMVRDSGYPNMKVLEFAFDPRDTGAANDYLPHNYTENCVAYTGTHDNETLVGWFSSISEKEIALVRDYLCDDFTPTKELYHPMIALMLRSAAATCVIPMQDYLGLDNSARINFPSTVGTNWRWRLKQEQLSDDLRQQILGNTRRYSRLNEALRKAEEEAALAAEKAAKEAALKAAMEAAAKAKLAAEEADTPGEAANKPVMTGQEPVSAQ